MNSVKTFLRSVRTLDSMIDRKQRQYERLAELRTKAESSTVSLNPMKVQTSHTNSNEDVLIKIIDLQYEINADIDRYCTKKREAMAIIDALEDERHRVLLYAYYLEGKKWEEVAVMMNYSWRHLHRLHSEALQAIGTSCH